MGFIKDIFSSPKPPPPVDFGAVGQQQAAQNVETARVGARLARPDVVTPFSTTTFARPRRISIWRPRPWPSHTRACEGRSRYPGAVQDLASGRLGQVPTGPLDVSGFQAEPTRFDYGPSAHADL
jgi:hypothetical protein